MDKAAEERKKVMAETFLSADWNAFYKKRRDWLIEQIGALEGAYRNDKTVTLRADWTTELYRLFKDGLEVLDVINEKFIQVGKDVSSLERRLKLAEEELTEIEKDRRIRGLASG
jgi:hypothetical protein